MGKESMNQVLHSLQEKMAYISYFSIHPIFRAQKGCTMLSGLGRKIFRRTIAPRFMFVISKNDMIEVIRGDKVNDLMQNLTSLVDKETSRFQLKRGKKGLSV